MSFRLNRSLAWALGVSLAAHVVLLLEVRRILPAVPEVPTAAIKASMKRVGNEAGSRGVGPAPTQEELSRKRSELPEQKASRPGVLAVPDGKSADRHPVTSSPVPASSPRMPPSKALNAGARGEPRPEPPVPGTTPNALGQEGINADDIRQYRTLLAIGAKRFKRYPQQAREQGREGSVEIAIDFRRLLPEPEVSVARSSGHPVLDEQALEMIRQSARQTDLPARLQGRDFRVVLPVTFSLDDSR